MLQQNRADYAKWLINPAVMIGLIINAWAVGRVLFGPLDNLTIPWLLLASACQRRPEREPFRRGKWNHLSG
jgi:hypothetical protein